uniref:Uncharacterized protein n=1 Tax=wastewater metagenome TaxID=527639 RepID=A0A0A8KXV6_9ZZZZ
MGRLVNGFSHEFFVGKGIEFGNHVVAQVPHCIDFRLAKLRLFPWGPDIEAEILRSTLFDPIPRAICTLSNERLLFGGERRKLLKDSLHIALVNEQQIAKMPKRHLVGGLARHLLDLRKFVDAGLTHASFLILGFFRSPVDSLGLVVIFVDLYDIQVKADDKFSVGSCACKKIAHHFRLIHAQKVWQVDHFALGRRHLTRRAFYANKIVAERNRRIASIDIAHHVFRGVERPTLSVVILASRLKIHFFKSPAHGPIHTPDEFGAF